MGRGSKSGGSCCEPRSSSSSSSNSDFDSSSSQDIINCSNCLNNEAPGNLKISIFGISDDSTGTCPDCHMNGDWVIPFIGFSSGTCRWSKTFITQICETPDATLIVSAAINAAHELTITVQVPFARTISWRISLDDPINCLDFNSLSVPFFSQTGIAGFCYVHGSAAAEVSVI